MKRLSFFDKFIYFINSLLSTLLLLSYALPYISPKNTPILAILSLFVPVLLIINIAFFLYWLTKLKKQLLLSGLILLIGWFVLTPFYKLSKKNTSLNSDLKVMSYNVRMFNRLEWIKENDVKKNIFSLIKENDPDILTIQENISSKEYAFDFPHKYIENKNEKHQLGMAIYSKFPIINKGSLKLENTGNNIIFSDIIRDKDTIRIYNFHLQSLNISLEKENLGEKNSEKLIQKIEQNFLKQVAQTELFLAHEQKWKGKKIICGDFNNTAYSWVYNQISKNKKDAFIEAGISFGKTYNYWFPFRIDFIIADNSAKINQHTTFSEEYSDHYPILARINW